MRFLQVFLDWWARDLRANRTPSSMNNAAPRDHFDKAGQYIFKDAKIGRLAATAKSLGATMTGIAQVQSNDTGASAIASGSSGTIFAGNTTAANCVVVELFYSASSGNQVTSFTSSIGTFTLQTSRWDGNTGVVETWTCANVTGAARTITVAITGAPTWYAQATEWSGVGSFGAPESVQGGGGFIGFSISLASTDGVANGTVLVAAGRASNAPVTTGPSSPWTYYNAGGITFSNSLGVAWMAATSSATETASWSGGLAAGTSLAAVGIVLIPATPPSSPTLTNPTNSSYADATAVISFSAVYNPNDSANQNAYAFRIKLSGGSYQWWNATTNAFVGSIVWNAITTTPGSTFTLNLPASKLTNGNVYNWSLASQDSASNLQGPFATDFTLSTAAAPTTAVTAPTGTISTNTPLVTWTRTLSTGDTQVDYQIIIESGSYGSTPGAGTVQWNSGVVASAATSAVSGVALAVAVSMRAFLQITDAFGQFSAWSYSTFTVAADVPATVGLTATNYNDPTSGLPEIQLQVQPSDNLLTLNQSSLEGNVTTGYAAGTNTTIAASNTWAQDGNYSLRLTATASGAVSATTPTGTSGIACIAGATVRAMASFHSPTTARACTVAIAFYNSAGSLISTSTSANVNSTLTGSGGQAFITMSAPTAAAYMTLIVNGAGLSASELLYADCMFLGPGSTNAWTSGGFVGNSTLIITRSDGVLVRGAGWGGSVGMAPLQTMVIYDTETPPDVAYTYSATVSATVSGAVVTSSPAVSAPVMVSPTHWDISDPNNISTGTKIEWFGDTRTFDQPEPQGVFPALGRTTNIVVRGTMQAETPTQLVLQFGGDADVAWKAFNALRKQQVTVMLRGDMPGDFYYVVLGSARPAALLRTSNRQADPSRTLTIAVAVVDRP